MSERPPVPFRTNSTSSGLSERWTPRRQPRGFRIHRVGRVHAHLGVDPLRQAFAQPLDLLDYELDRLFGGPDLVREELGVDDPGEPRLDELRQALAIG